MLWTAIATSGLMAGSYFSFPPILAHIDPGVRGPAGAMSGMLMGSAGRANRIGTTTTFGTAANEAHRSSTRMLETGLARLTELPGYTATFSKWEVVGGKLDSPQAMAMKVRHQPFGVYMKWVEGAPGRELLYVAGENDGEMICQPGGWKGRVLGPIRVNPTGSIALSESRHPVTEAGLYRLTEKLLEYRRAESGWETGFTCESHETTFDGRPCLAVSVVYDSPERAGGYRKSVVLIDQEWQFAVKVQTYGWPGRAVPADRLDAETLLEEYAYADIRLESPLAAADFDLANADYKLRRR